MLKYKMLLSFLVLCMMSSLSHAQQPSMSASTGLGPGNSFTLFITFQNPMPNVQGIGCAFALKDPKTRAGGFRTSVEMLRPPDKR